MHTQACMHTYEHTLSLLSAAVLSPMKAMLPWLCPKQNLHEHGASHLRHLGGLPSVCVRDRLHCRSWDGHSTQAGPEQTWPWCGYLKEFVTCFFDRDGVAHDLCPFSAPDNHMERKEKSSSGIKPFSSKPNPSLHTLEIKLEGQFRFEISASTGQNLTSTLTTAYQLSWV